MTKVVIYTRFSPRRNADESESCETQVDICKEYAKLKGYEIGRVFKDKDVSGKDEYREKLWDAIESMSKGSVLLVYKRDRLARNVYLSEQINRAVIAKGGRIEAVSGDVEGDGPEHVMIRQVLASIAEYERKMIACRTSHAMRQHQKNGKRMGRYAPYGWRIDPIDSTMLEPVQHEQVAIDLIRKLYETDGETPHAIAKTMSEVMPEAARSGRWNAKTVGKIVNRL